MFPIDPHIKLLIFDCDGTLFDTTPLHYFAWRDTYAAENKEFVTKEEHNKDLAGMHSNEIAKHINELFGYEFDTDLIALTKEKIFFEHYVPRAMPMEKTISIIKQYKNELPMAVASNGYAFVVHAMLDANNMRDWFDTIVTVDDVKQGKPAPDMFLEAARRMGVKPSECLVFEDSPSGFEAAKRAGMTCIDVADLSDINIYYRIQGSGEPIILIAGLAQDHTIWNGVAEKLSQHYQVITFDNRGVGQTDKPDMPFSTEQMADDLAALMDRLHIDKAHLVGHSMGGYIAMQLAAKYPEKVNKLILCASCVSRAKNISSYLDDRIAAVKAHLPLEELVRTAAPNVFSKTFLAQPGIIETIIAKEKNNPYPQPAFAFIRQAEACKTHDAHAVLKNIKSPTLVIAAAEDIIMPAQVTKELADDINGAVLVTIPGAGHMVQIEQPDLFVKVISDFFK